MTKVNPGDKKNIPNDRAESTGRDARGNSSETSQSEKRSRGTASERTGGCAGNGTRPGGSSGRGPDNAGDVDDAPIPAIRTRSGAFEVIHGPDPRAFVAREDDLVVKDGGKRSLPATDRRLPDGGEAAPAPITEDGEGLLEALDAAGAHEDMLAYVRKARERGGTPILSTLRTFHRGGEGGLGKFPEVSTPKERALFHDGAAVAYTEYGSWDATNREILQEIIDERVAGGDA